MWLVVTLSAVACRQESFVSPPSDLERSAAAATPAPESPIGTLASEMTRRLVVRAQQSERVGSADDWDHAIEISMSIRARTELLRARAATGPEAAAIREAALAAAPLVMSYEAEGDLGRSFSRASLPGVRGWGTSKPIKIGPVSAPTAVDAYSTSVTLGGLAALAEYLGDDGDPAGASLFAKIAPIADHWIGFRMFDVPSGGRSWQKIVTRDPAIFRMVVFNTDAMFARDLLILAKVARRLGDSARATSYETTAEAVGRRIHASLVAPMIDSEGHAHPEKWVYGLEVTDDGRVVAQRIEDSNHASFTLDFIALALERGLGDAHGNPVFSSAELDALGSIIGQAVFVRRPDGEPAYTLWVDPAEVSTTGERGKRKVSDFAFTGDARHTAAMSSWWKQLAGSSRALDMGSSIRTSWGWSEAVQKQPALFEPIGRYLAAQASERGDDAPANLLLSEAVWLRLRSHATAGAP